MEERPRNISEDDSQEDLENEDGELSLNRRRLFLKNGFFREWLTSSSKESEDENQDEDDKPVFGSGKKFKGFLSKVFEDEPTSDEEEPEKTLFETGDFSADSDDQEIDPELPAEATEVRIEHEEVSVQEKSEGTVLPLETDVQQPEITQEYSEPEPEAIKFTQEDTDSNEPEPEHVIISKEDTVYGGVEPAKPAAVEAPKADKTEVPRKDRSGALHSLMAAEFLSSRRRDRKITKQAKRANRNLDAIKESLNANSTSETTIKSPKLEKIKDDKNTTDKQAEKEKVSRNTEIKRQENKPDKLETKREIVIEKTTKEIEQIREPQAEVYFDKRHEVMGLEKPRSIDQEVSKETLKEAKQQAPVSVATVLASKQIDQLEYIPAPIPLSKSGNNNAQQTFEQEISPTKSAYRESVEAGFLVGLIIIGFIAIYVISK